MTVSAIAIPILSDNYAWLVRDDQTGFTAVVDPAEEAPIVAAIESFGGQLDMILLTHHHDDHVAAVGPIQNRYKASIVGAAADKARLPKLDMAVSDGDTIPFGSTMAQVMETPGHTIGHISYFIQPGAVLLCGDTLFSLGCGKLLEGTAAMMFESLNRLSGLPEETLVCCGHEYTANNARFAITEEPNNLALQRRQADVLKLRGDSLPTIPTKLGDELEQNPFLHNRDVGSFAAMRSRKDQFK